MTFFASYFLFSPPATISLFFSFSSSSSYYPFFLFIHFILLLFFYYFYIGFYLDLSIYFYCLIAKKKNLEKLLSIILFNFLSISLFQVIVPDPWKAVSLSIYISIVTFISIYLSLISFIVYLRKVYYLCFKALIELNVACLKCFQPYKIFGCYRLCQSICQMALTGYQAYKHI